MIIKCIKSIPPIIKHQIVTIHDENTVYICLKNKYDRHIVIPKHLLKKYFEVKEEILLIFEL